MLAKKRILPIIAGEVEMKLNKIEMIPINDLKLWEDNPRFNIKAVPKLARTFQAHGVRSPVIVWRDNMTIYKGNTTYKALKLLGCAVVPAILQDFESEAAAKAYGMNDNKSSEFSAWDENVLTKLMSVESMQPYKNKTGFTETEIESLIKKQSKNIVAEKDAINLPICQIRFHPKIKDALKEYMEKTIARKFGNDVIIRF